jgi:hypothetical protein
VNLVPFELRFIEKNVNSAIKWLEAMLLLSRLLTNMTIHYFMHHIIRPASQSHRYDVS